MQPKEQEHQELLTELPPARGGPGAERTSLVEVLTDFLRGASQYVLEDDGETRRA